MLILITAAILSFMIFFPVVVATSVFKVLDDKQSSKFLRIFFPKYYLFGFVLSLTGLIIAIFDKNNMSLIVFLLIIIGFLFSRQFLMPIINKAKDNNNEKKFNILHRVSVLINFIQISLCVFLLIIFLK
ncbi:MAG: DUF4149 domain-containing protein [Alphaproteobacteria bacterium]|nr:DUF4149 domain-containing protein [Alphaproteobacteria bacterium]